MNEEHAYSWFANATCAILIAVKRLRLRDGLPYMFNYDNRIDLVLPYDYWKLDPIDATEIEINLN